MNEFEEREVCEKSGKFCLSKREAQEKVNRINRGKCRKKANRVYQCPYCNYWHITSRPDFCKDHHGFKSSDKYYKYKY
ncbi:MAG: hypothetical protein IJL70_01105 [Treponema sp.]|nr:hypothetical protein [Treponema sp.]